MLSNPLSSVLSLQNPKSAEEYRQSLRDILQKICLLGLWRGGFYEHAAFYEVLP